MKYFSRVESLNPPRFRLPEVFKTREDVSKLKAAKCGRSIIPDFPFQRLPHFSFLPSTHYFVQENFTLSISVPKVSSFTSERWCPFVVRE